MNNVVFIDAQGANRVLLVDTIRIIGHFGTANHSLYNSWCSYYSGRYSSTAIPFVLMSKTQETLYNKMSLQISVPYLLQCIHFPDFTDSQTLYRR